MKKLALVLLLAGCAGGLSQNAIPQPPQSGAPAPSQGDVRGSVIIKIPLKIDARRAHFVSPSTRSALLTVAPAPGCAGCSAKFSEDVSLMPSSSACAQTATGIACSMSFGIKPGSYVGSLSTYDGKPNCQSSVSFPCRELSVDQSFGFKAESGKPSVVNVTLDGVPQGFSYYVLDAGVMIDRFAYYADFAMIGAGTKGRILLYARDGDGNAILGPGAPKISVSIAGGGFKAQLGGGNVVTFTAPATMTGGAPTVTYTASGPGCSAPKASCKLQGTIEFDPMTGAAEYGTNSIQIYPEHRYDPQPFATITKGVSGPVALEFDSKANAFVANASNGTVTQYAQPWAGGPVATYSSGLKKPALLASGPNGDLAVGDADNDVVEVFVPPSTAKVASIAVPAAPSAIAFDSGSNLWVATAGQVARYAPPYTGTPTVILNGAVGIANPVSLSYDAFNKSLYVADAGKGAVMGFKQPFTGQPFGSYAYPNVGYVNAYGYDITICGKGNIYLVDQNLLTIGVTIPINDGFKQTCAVNWNGDLFEGDAKYGDIAEYNYNYFNFFGLLTEGLKNPTALATFPSP